MDNKRISFIFLFLLYVLSLYSQIINLSNDETDSHQPFFVNRNDTEYAFWVDEQAEYNNINFKYFQNNQWSDVFVIPIAGEVKLLTFMSTNIYIYFLFKVNVSEGEFLLIAKIQDYSQVTLQVIENYSSLSIVSASLLIDDQQTFHIAWELYNYNESLYLYYSSSQNLTNWDTPTLLYEDDDQEQNIRTQLALDVNNNLYCFWLADYPVGGILYAVTDDYENWTMMEPLVAYGDLNFGYDFTVKNDADWNIHIVSNHILLTGYQMDILYLYWNNQEWSEPELVPYRTYGTAYSNERWNPEIDFLQNGDVYVTWNHYSYNIYMNPIGNWIGSSVKTIDGWHENGLIAEGRESIDIKILIKNDQILNIWQDQSDGDYDIYYTMAESFTSTMDYTIPAENVVTNFQNYPNPFNPSTNILFDLSHDSEVVLSIYNIKGQKIKTLVNSVYVKGSHSIIWNGVDDLEKPVSSGVYYYILNVNGKTEAVKKCLLLK